MMCRWPSMNPAIAVMPLASSTLAPFAAAGPVTTESIFPLRTMIEPCSITWPVPVMMRAFAMTRSCAASGCAEASTQRRTTRRKAARVMGRVYRRTRNRNQEAGSTPRVDRHGRSQRAADHLPCALRLAASDDDIDLRGLEDLDHLVWCGLETRGVRLDAGYSCLLYTS